jgi:hypothetical protein
MLPSHYQCKQLSCYCFQLRRRDWNLQCLLDISPGVVKVYFWTWDLGILTKPITSPVPIPIPIPASSTLAHACSRHRLVSGPRAETRAVRGGLDRIALHCIIALHRAAGVYRLVSSRVASRRLASRELCSAPRHDSTLVRSRAGAGVAAAKQANKEIGERQ